MNTFSIFLRPSTILLQPHGGRFLASDSDFCRLPGNVWPSSGTSEMQACYSSACLALYMCITKLMNTFSIFLRPSTILLQPHGGRFLASDFRFLPTSRQCLAIKWHLRDVGLLQQCLFGIVYVHNKLMNTFSIFLRPSTILLQPHGGRFLASDFRFLPTSRQCLAIKWHLRDVGLLQQCLFGIVYVHNKVDEHIQHISKALHHTFTATWGQISCLRFRFLPTFRQRLAIKWHLRDVGLLQQCLFGIVQMHNRLMNTFSIFLRPSTILLQPHGGRFLASDFRFLPTFRQRLAIKWHLRDVGLLQQCLFGIVQVHNKLMNTFSIFLRPSTILLQPHGGRFLASDFRFLPTSRQCLAIKWHLRDVGLLQQCLFGIVYVHNKLMNTFSIFLRPSTILLQPHGGRFLASDSDFCRLPGNVWPSSGTSEMQACYSSACLALYMCITS